MHIKEIWRYPVKSMRGERVAEADVLRTGIEGDREVVVVDRETGRLMTARTFPDLLGFSGGLDANGDATVNGLPWDADEVNRLVSEAVGRPARLVSMQEDPDRFDVLPLLVATDGAIAAMGLDSRRFRPNIIVGGVSGLTELDWEGCDLRLGPVGIHAAQLRMRCNMTTFDPDTLAQDRNVLRRIVRERDGKMALDCTVTAPGCLRDNDPVEVL